MYEEEKNHQPKQKFQLCTPNRIRCVCIFFFFCDFLLYIIYTDTNCYVLCKSTSKQLVKCMTVYVRGNVSCVNRESSHSLCTSFLLYSWREQQQQQQPKTLAFCYPPTMAAENLCFSIWWTGNFSMCQRLHFKPDLLTKTRKKKSISKSSETRTKIEKIA